MAEQSAQQRTEQPTPKRLEDARKKGQVPRSRELNVLISLLTAGLGYLLLGEQMILGLTDMMQRSLDLEPTRMLGEQAMQAGLLESSRNVLGATLPLLALLTLATLLSPLALGGWSFRLEALAPKLERISPLKGLARIFSVRSLVELLKAILKFLLVSSFAATSLWLLLDWMQPLALATLQQSIPEVGEQFVYSLLLMSSAMLLVVALDVPFQLWDHRKKLMMTRQEVRDELKESEGRPEIKGHVRNLQQQAAQQRMMRELPDADVVITNPTHFAVALRYVQGDSAAPIVVAKGRDLLAQHIRQVAQLHDITLFSAPPLARALYRSTDIGQAVPADLYVAVARVLAYVYQLRAGNHPEQLVMPSAESLAPGPNYKETVDNE